MSANNSITHLPDRLPTIEEASQAKQLSRALSKFADADRVSLKIKAKDKDADNIEEDLVLPGMFFHMLLDILSETSKGNAISLMPVKAQLTTQQAADFLNVSRPYLVKLLDEQKISHHKVGTHRRVYLKDLLEYKATTDNARKVSLDELTKLSQDLGMGY